jgi:hypothetical protein
MKEGWGVGDQADSKAFDTVPEGELIFGQFPHSRSDNNIYLRRPDGEIVPFDGHRRLIDVDIKSSNYMKDSYYSGDEIRKSVLGSIIVDGVKLVEIFGREVQQVMRWVDRAIDEYSEHPSNWFSKQAREEMPGRRIYYHDQPATIKRLVEDQGCVIIETEPGFVPPRRDQDEDMYDYWEDWKVDGHYEVKEEVLSPHIWWWRK